MQALWRLAAPVAFAAAGVLFATSAGAANGGQLRGDPQRPGRPDPGRAAAAPTTSPQRVERLRAEVEDATDRAGAADRRIGSRAAALARRSSSPPGPRR